MSSSIFCLSGSASSFGPSTRNPVAVSRRGGLQAGGVEPGEDERIDGGLDPPAPLRVAAKRDGRLADRLERPERLLFGGEQRSGRAAGFIPAVFARIGPRRPVLHPP